VKCGFRRSEKLAGGENRQFVAVIRIAVERKTPPVFLSKVRTSSAFIWAPVFRAVANGGWAGE
jgi:hypothetical protein